MQKLISIGELIDETLDFYKNNFTDLMGISAWLLLVAFAGVVGWLLYPNAEKLAQMVSAGSGVELTLTEQIGIGLVVMNSILILPLMETWVFSSMADFINTRLDQNRQRIKTSLKRGWKHFFPVLLSRILYTVVIIASVMLGILPWIIRDFMTLQGIASMFVGLVSTACLFIAAFLAVRWSVSYYLGGYGYANIIDNKHGLQSLKMSSKLTSGRYWATLIRLAVPKILFVGVGFVLVSLLGPVLNMVQSVLVQGIPQDVALRLGTMLTLSVAIIGMVFIYPLIYTADILTYRNLRETMSEKNKKPQGESKALNA